MGVPATVTRNKLAATTGTNRHAVASPPSANQPPSDKPRELAHRKWFAAQPLCFSCQRHVRNYTGLPYLRAERNGRLGGCGTGVRNGSCCDSAIVLRRLGATQ